MDFGEAIIALKAGKTTKRAAWSNGAKLAMFKEGDLDTIGWSSDHHPRETYRPTHPDMLAGDWEAA